MLSPYRVLDLSDDKGFLCGKILGDLGADVIKIEKPGGDPSRKIGPFFHDIPDPEKSLYWFAYNTGKRGITLDIETPDGKETFKKLVKTADFIIETFPPGYLDSLELGYKVLSEINPGVILTSITAFGQTGPYKDFKTSDIVAQAMSGFMYLCGDPDGAPMQISFPQAFSWAGAQAAMGTMMAHHYREQTGEGQHVDVSIHGCMVPHIIVARLFWEFRGQNLRREGTYRQQHGAMTYLRQRGNWTCRDGYVCFLFYGGAHGEHTNRSLVQWMDSEGRATDFLKNMNWAAWDIGKASQEEIDRLSEPIGKFFLAHTRDELFNGALERGIMFYPLATTEDIVKSPQLAARDFWTEIEHPELGTNISYPGVGVKLSETSWRVSRRAPLIGEHNEEIYGRESGSPPNQSRTTQPGGLCLPKTALDDVKVVDFGWVSTAPIMAKYMADHGAQVVRIESSTAIDTLRVTGPYKDNTPGVDRSSFFAANNNDKYDITLNLKHPRGIEIAKRLIAWADVVVEGYTTGTVGRWGLGYDELKKVNPDIIMLSTCNMGQSGPYARHPGFGSQLTAYAGFAHLIGWPDQEPAFPHGAYTDFIGPLLGTTAIIAALDYRRRTGRGQYIDVSQYEGAVNLLIPLILDFMINGRTANRMGNRCPNAAPHGAYPCRGEDRWCAIAVFADQEWDAFCRAIGNPAWTTGAKFATLIGRKENEDELDRLVEQWTSPFTAEQVMEMMQAAGVAAGVVQTPEDICHDSQLKHRHYFWELEHPVIGKHYYEGPGFILSKTPAELKKPAPCLGEHTAYVCTEILGISDEEFIQLLDEGVFE